MRVGPMSEIKIEGRQLRKYLKYVFKFKNTQKLVLLFGVIISAWRVIFALFIVAGIGSDDAYIICKVWDRTKKENSHLTKSDLVRLVIKHSAVAVFVTTLTTVAAFLSSYWSSVTAVRCFR